MSTDRHILVFLSSTVRALQAERHHLVNFTFPQLRKLCESRGITWSEVDPISESTGEGSAQGIGVQRRFEDLQRGIPYFIGLLGARYDLEPANLSQELLDSWPCLADHPQASLAELEITCGVLKNGAMRGRGFFYFRDPKFLDDLTKETSDLSEENNEIANRLRSLKQSVRDAHRHGVCRLRENYASVADLGQWVIDAFTQLIDERFPEAAVKDDAARLALEFEEAQQRADEARRRAEEAELRRAERKAAKRAEDEALRIERSRRRAAEKEEEARKIALNITGAQRRAEDQFETEEGTALFARRPKPVDDQRVGLATTQPTQDDTPADDRPAESGASASPQPYDDDVMFTAYRPRTVVPQKWYSLLAFAHLSERRPDAPADEPDPLVEVQRQAQQILADAIEDYKSSEESGASVPRGGEIIFQPFVEGVEFNPPTRSFRWEESVHREEFKLRASPSLDGQVARGWLRVYLGPLILAQINLAIKVDSKHVSTVDKQSTATESARPLRKVFASYSHRDLAIVEQIEKTVSEAHLGVQYLRDATTLRAGEVWNEALMRMIKEADMFQLFWSTNSMYSPFVRQEYQYALSLGKPHFVLPVYWETPFPQKPDENLPPDELRRLHFENLNLSGAGDHPPAPDYAPVASQTPPTTLSSYDGAAEPVAEESPGPVEQNTTSHEIETDAPLAHLPAEQEDLEMAPPTGGSSQSIASAAPTGELLEPTGSLTTDRDATAACPNCRASVRRRARFCSRCGASLQAEEKQKNSGSLQVAAPPPMAMDAPSRDYPMVGLAAAPAAPPLPPAPSFTPAPPSAPLMAMPPPKKSSKTGVVGLAVTGLAFLIVVPIVLVIAATNLGSPAGNGGEMPLLLILLFLFMVGGALLIGGIVILLVTRKKR